MNNQVAIIIPHYNGEAILRECIDSLLQQTHHDYKIIVVDDASTDGSADNLRTIYPDIVTLRNKENVGFAKSANQGIRYALDEGFSFIALLNNDAVASPTWLEKLISVMNAHKDAGAVGGKILQRADHTVLDAAGDYFDPVYMNILNRGKGEKDRGQYESSTAVISLCGAAVLYRSEALRDIKYKKEFFDEQFYMYVEDVDLCLRMWVAGWRSMYTPDAIVYHAVSQTSLQVSKLFRYKLAVRNRLLMAIKLFPISSMFKTAINVFLPVKPLLRYFRFHKAEGNKPPKRPIFGLSVMELVYIFGFVLISHFIYIPSMIRKRRRLYSRYPEGPTICRELFQKFSNAC